MSTSTSARPRVPIDPRIRERRVAVARAEGRRRLRILLAALGVVAFAGGAVAATRSPLLDVDRVEIAGAGRTAPADLVAASGAGGHPLLIEFDTAAAARRIEALPWVRTARVQRRWPDAIRITIVERVAVAVVPAQQGWAVVDADGRIVDVTADAPDLVALAAPAHRRRVGSRLPRHLGAGLAAAEALTATDSPTLRAAVRAVVVGGDERERQLGLQLSGGGTVQLGRPADLPAKLVAAATVLESVPAAAIDTLDVRVPTAPVVRRKPPLASKPPTTKSTPEPPPAPAP